MDEANETSFANLIAEVETFGLDRIIHPFDIMNLALRISEHPECRDALAELVTGMNNPSNFIRHIATRTLQIMGPATLTDTIVAQALVMVRNDDAPSVRAQAIRLLARSNRHDAALIAALKTTAEADVTDYVRDQARQAVDSF